MTDPTIRYPLPDDPGSDPLATPPGPDAEPPAATPAATTTTATTATSSAVPPPPPPQSTIGTASAPPPPATPGWTPPRGAEPRWPAIVFGVILIVVGLWFFAEVTLGLDLPTIRWGQLWPLILIVVGGLILYGSRIARKR
jgi:uncharacterized integral membrane protein